jgi:hypothetical protein
LFINDLCSKTVCNFLSFADNVNIFATLPQLRTAYFSHQTQLCANWCTANHMKLNGGKASLSPLQKNQYVFF